MIIRSLLAVLAAAGLITGVSESATAAPAERTCNQLYANEQHALANYKIQVRDYGKNSERATKAGDVYEHDHYLYVYQCG